MQMTTSDGHPMFTSIDMSWDEGIVFTYPRLYEQEARNRIADLASYLHFIHGDLVLCKYFTPEAAQRAVSSPWNDQKKRAISTLDQEFDEILQDCDDINWLKQPSDSKVVRFEKTTEQLKSQPLFNHLPNDDKSLGTFGSKSDTILSNHSGQKRQFRS